MADILFIKTSSLGDVIHHMPALTEARAQRPDASFAWLVEEAFAPLVLLHPAVDRVVPIAWRRWRKSLWSPATLGEIGASIRAIRAERYGEIIDSQGLLRSAAIARAARGRRHGYDRASIREPLASALYDVRYSVSRELHAVERNRILTGRVLGYAPQVSFAEGLDELAAWLEGQIVIDAVADAGTELQAAAAAQVAATSSARNTVADPPVPVRMTEGSGRYG